MDWKKFLKPSILKFVILIILFLLSIFLGFFKMSSCFLDENGNKACRECGIEGIFNPLLRPISFFLANVIRGLLISHDIQLCGATFAILFYWPLDMIYLYFLSSLIVWIYDKVRKKK